MTEREMLEHKIAGIIAEHVTIGYQLGPDGMVNPDTITVASALGAACMVLYELRPAILCASEQSTPPKER